MRFFVVVLLVVFFGCGCDRKPNLAECPPPPAPSATQAIATISGSPNFRWEAFDPNSREPPVTLLSNKDTPVAGGVGWACIGRVSDTANDEGIHTHIADLKCSRGDEVVEVNALQKEGLPLARGSTIMISKGGHTTLTVGIAPKMGP